MATDVIDLQNNPFPRLVAGEGYQAPPLLRWPVVVAVILLALDIVLWTVGVATHPGRPSDAGQPTNANQPAYAAALSAAQAGIIPAPDGYTLQTSSSGPVTAADFNHMTVAGEAQLLGYVSGYNCLYSDPDGLHDLMISTFRLATAADASVLVSDVLQGASATHEESTIGSLDTMPGSVVLLPHKAADGSFDYIVAAANGSRMMLLDYATISAAPTSGALPAQLVDWAEEQYHQLGQPADASVRDSALGMGTSQPEMTGNHAAARQSGPR